MNSTSPGPLSGLALETTGTRDGRGAGDHDQPYTFGRRPRARYPFPFTAWQLARLLVLRGRVQDGLFGADDRGAADASDYCHTRSGQPPAPVRHGFVTAGSGPGRLLIIATPAGMERYHEESGRAANARTLPPQAGAGDIELAAALAEKYRFEVVGPRLSPDAVL